MNDTRGPYATCKTFGELLKFLRRRARLSQRELSIEVGYSESHISRLEGDERPPDRTSVLALFVPALHIQDEPEIIDRLLALCESRHLSSEPTSPVTTAASVALHNRHLPVQLTSFVGRDEELSEICMLLRTPGLRLLTLTGSGGCGKTRLALRAGELLASDYQEIRLVELAPVTSAHLLPETVARALGLGVASSDPLSLALSELENLPRVLLILDNCEHLVDSVASLAIALLQAGSGLQILATSRETLSIPSEHVYRVLPMALPPEQLGTRQTQSQIAPYDAVRLFVERARASQYTFALNDQNASAVMRICRHMDGVPLGIELAAAWIGILSAEQIAERIEADGDLRTPSERMVIARHRSLRAAIEWSYNLLGDQERVFLRRISVFAGGWSLESAGAVIFGSDTRTAALVTDPVMHLLGQLVRKSMVVVDHLHDGSTRYRLLESVTEYLRDILEQSGEIREFKDRHLFYFLALAHGAQAQREARAESDWPVRLDCELDNLRAALSWSLESGAIDAAVSLAIALGPYWRHRGYYQEGRRWLSAVCERHTQPDPARAKALLMLAVFTRLQGDMDQARHICDEVLAQARHFEDHAIEAEALENLGWTIEQIDRLSAARYFQESLAVARRTNDRRSMGRLLVTLAQFAREDADLELATCYLSDALSLLRALNDHLGISEALNGLAEIESLKGNYARTADLLAESMALATDFGSAHDLAWINCSLAENCWHRGDFEAALYHGESGLALFMELESELGLAIVLHHLGLAALELGQIDQAALHLHASLRHSLSQHLDFMTARCLAGVAAVVLRNKRPYEAAKVLGSAMVVLTAEANKLAPADRAYYDAIMARCRDELGPAAFEAAWRAGQSISVQSCAMLQSTLYKLHARACASAGIFSYHASTG